MSYGRGARRLRSCVFYSVDCKGRSKANLGVDVVTSRTTYTVFRVFCRITPSPCFATPEHRPKIMKIP